MISIVKQLIETDREERTKQATNHKKLYQMAKILDINTGPEPTNKEDLEAEIERLNSIIQKQNSDLSNESEKYQRNICQEKVSLIFMHHRAYIGHRLWPLWLMLQPVL